MQTPPLSFDPTFMKDVQCVETNEIFFFPICIFRVIVKIHRKCTIFRTKITITRKIKKRKNQFDFPFDSAESGSFM